MLNKELKYYHDHQKNLIKKYANKFIVIKGKKVIGVYDSHTQAYNETIMSQELGTFLIRHIGTTKESH